MSNAKIMPALFAACWLSACFFPTASSAGAEENKIPSARIVINAGEQTAKINPLIYGQFIEHLGMCIKDGLWTPEDKEHELVLGGVRKDLYEKIEAMRMPMIRWPGGCFSDGYHWQDGIGPAAERPERKNLAWARGDAVETAQGPLENNAFGTDEFLRLCEALGTEPLINVNLGSGSAEEARQWVEYVNGGVDTEWGRRRAENGHPERTGRPTGASATKAGATMRSAISATAPPMPKRIWNLRAQ